MHVVTQLMFNLYAEYIMGNDGLDLAQAENKIARLVELQAGFKIARRNINNLRYADDTTLMTESEE